MGAILQWGDLTCIPFMVLFFWQMAILPAIANDLCIDSHMNTSK
jgi:hypothetical protein